MSPVAQPKARLDEVKIFTQEAAVSFATDRALGAQVAGLRVEQGLAAGLLAPTEIGDLDRLCGSVLEDGGELDSLYAQFVAKEAIDRAAVVLVSGVDRTQDIEINTVLAELAPSPHHPVEGALSAAVGVMDLARAIDATSNQKLVFLEEGAPVVIEQDAVGLEGVLHNLAPPAVLLDEFDGPPEEFELRQRGLAILPSHGYIRSAVRLQQLPDVGIEGGLGHPLLVVRVQRLLRQEEAIFAINIASGADRLRQQVGARWRIEWQSTVGHKSHFRTSFSRPSSSSRTPAIKFRYINGSRCSRASL